MKRQAVYPFRIKHLKLDSEGVFDKMTELYDESKTVLETPEQMRVFNDLTPLPQHALEPGAIVPI